MNTSTLHPVVLEKLQRFSRQRRRLILWRGLCSTAAVWLGAMIGLALVDRLVLLEDGVRMALSFFGYAATAAVVWRTCVRYLAHMPGPRELARLIEVAAPQLREELLAAVELSESDQQPHWDSDQFRAALQQLAAQHVGGIQVESLLTRRLITSWLYAAGAAVVVFLALVSIPGLHFGQAFARAMLPAANIARYSTVQIEVLAPSPADLTVPEGDAVPVTVRVTGGDVQQVILETFPKRGSRERVAMALSAVNQFTAPIQINQSPVLYRIRASDAITRKFLLDPRARPQVVRFHKTYRYPTYARLDTRKVTEENGDLDAIDGTEVELNLDVDQPIKQASLRLELGKVTREVPLQRIPSGQLSARLPLTAAGTYRVQLVAASSGFENKYSPQYEIRVRPDLLPSVKIEKPEQDQLVLPPDALVNLTGTAKDDLSISNVEQAVQINHGKWQTFPLQQTTGTVVTVARAWDLFELGVHPGDRVLTKLVATDLKGQRGESVPLRIMITAPGFDPQRHVRLKAKQAVDKALQELREAADKLDQKTQSAKTALSNPAAEKLAKQQALLAARTAAEAVAEKAAEAQRQIQEALPKMTNMRESKDLVLAGTAVSRAQREGVEQLKNALERAADHAATGDDKAARTDLQKSPEMLNAAAGAPRIANDTYRQIVAADEAHAITSDLTQINTDQRTLAEQLRDPSQTERAARRQNVTANQTKDVEKQMKDLSQHTWDSPSNIARDRAKDLAREREQVEKALAAEPTAEKLKPVADAMQRSLENAANQMRSAERELAQRADNARKWMAEQFPSAAENIAKLARQTAPTPDQFEAAVNQLKDRAALEEKRPHADAQFAADTAHAADAVQALTDAASPTNAATALKAIEKAFRKLETGHDVGEQATALRQLAGQERWEKPTAGEAAERAKDWKHAQQEMKALPQKIDQAQLPTDAGKALNKIAESQPAQQVGSEMNKRQENAAPTKNVAQPVAQVAADVAAVKKQLQPFLDEARAEIEKAAPKLSERLAGLAKSAEKMKGKSEDQAKTAGKPETTEKVRAEAKNLSHDQAKLDNRVNDARDAIRRDANVQNLATEEGRERARDADDANAMLREPTPNANDMLQHAAQTQQPDKQQNSLKAAADMQGKLAETLNKLAEHYKNLENGKTEPTRSALREAEKDMGLKPTLDAEYAKAKALEQLAGLSPQDQLKELEKALQNNKPMRSELSDIAKNALQNAANDLQNQANKENKIAQQMGTPAEQAKQIAEAAKKLAQQDVPAAAEKAGQNAKPEMNSAAQKLDNVAKNIPQDGSKSPAEMAKGVQDQVAPLQQAANDLKNAANKSADAAKPQAQANAQKASELANQAQQLANALQQTPAQMQAAAAQQPAIEQNVRDAGNDIERAGRHEERLGQEAAGKQMQQLGNQIESQTGAQVADAGQQMAQAQTPAQDQSAAKAAGEAIQQAADKANAMAQQPTPPPTPPASPESTAGQLAAANGEAAQWMARALDSLDAAMNPSSQAAQQAGTKPEQGGQPGKPEQGQGQGKPEPGQGQDAASQAAQAAAQSQASAMANARGQGLTPGQQPMSENEGDGKGAAFRAAGMDVGDLPENIRRLRGDWGKLPPKLARDLMESQREGVSGEYREMVELYFRAVADKAREKK